MVPLLNKKRRSIFIILFVMGLSACVTPSGRPVPIAPDRTAEDRVISEKRLVLKETYIAGVMGAEYILPHGVYRPEGKDEDGIYFKAPIRIKKRGLFRGLLFPWTKGMVDGGIWTRKDDPCSSDPWIYVRKDNGDIRMEVLYPTFGWGCGKFWYVESGPELTAEVSFVDGKPHGPYKIFDLSERLRGQGTFQNGRKEGLWSFWGSKTIKTVELSYRNGLKEGPCRMWYSAFASDFADPGTPKLKVTFVSDQMHGEHVGWYGNGQVNCRTQFIDGRITTSLCWHEDGTALSEADSMETARDQHEADNKLLSSLDEIVTESIADRMRSESSLD